MLLIRLSPALTGIHNLLRGHRAEAAMRETLIYRLGSGITFNCRVRRVDGPFSELWTVPAAFLLKVRHKQRLAAVPSLCSDNETQHRALL